jgi:hypothetical protein
MSQDLNIRYLLAFLRANTFYIRIIYAAGLALFHMLNVARNPLFRVHNSSLVMHLLLPQVVIFKTYLQIKPLNN